MSKAAELAALIGSQSSLSNRNLIINGAMQVAQRGTSFTASSTSAYWGVDRFAFQTNANTDSTIAQVADAPVGFEYSFKFTNGTAYTPVTTDFGRVFTRLEGYNVNNLNLGTSDATSITLSFWVKSSVTGSFGAMVGGSGNGIYVWSYSISQANTWEYKTLTVPAGTITTFNGSTTNGQGFQVAWDMGEGPNRSNSAGWHSNQPVSEMGLTSGTKIVATASATWQITGVQLEVGEQATPFEHRSYGDELARCQRYYAKVYTSNRAQVDSGELGAHFTFKTTMRASPTMGDFDPGSPENVTGLDQFYGTNVEGSGASITTGGAGNRYVFGASATADAEL